MGLYNTVIGKCLNCQAEFESPTFREGLWGELSEEGETTVEQFEREFGKFRSDEDAK